MQHIRAQATRPVWVQDNIRADARAAALSALVSRRFFFLRYCVLSSERLNARGYAKISSRRVFKRTISPAYRHDSEGCTLFLSSAEFVLPHRHFFLRVLRVVSCS